jgi:hypothetical protein
MNEQTSIPEIQFRSDFAARVLARADSVARRRRNIRMTGIAAAIGVIVAGGVWSLQAVRHIVPTPAPVVQVANAGEFSWIDEAGQSDPMQWIFPDAQPVVRFADRYSDAMMGNARQRQQTLFADASDEGEIR